MAVTHRPPHALGVVARNRANARIASELDELRPGRPVQVLREERTSLGLPPDPNPTKDKTIRYQAEQLALVQTEKEKAEAARIEAVTETERLRQKLRELGINID